MNNLIVSIYADFGGLWHYVAGRDLPVILQGFDAKFARRTIYNVVIIETINHFLHFLLAEWAEIE